MKKWKFEVIQRDTYREIITIEAKTEEEAQEKLDNQLDEESIDNHKNTYEGMQLETYLINE